MTKIKPPPAGINRPSKAYKAKRAAFRFEGAAREKFLELYADTGQLHLACEGAGVSPGAAKQYIKEHPEFAELCDELLEAFRDRLEDEARRRAVEGVEEPVYQQGALVGSKQRYSDALLIALLKRHRKREYSDQASLDLNVKGGVLVSPGAATSAEDWAAAHNAPPEQGDKG